MATITKPRTRSTPTAKPAASRKATSDFRYDTGEARVPWAAVGEAVGPAEVAELIRFLIRPAEGKTEQYKARMERVAAALHRLHEVGRPAGKLTLGNQVKVLEEQLAQFLHARHAVFTCNCTAGFEIAYKYAGLKPGDEVIAPAITFIASIAYPLSVGAKVVLADVDPRTMNMDPADVLRKLTPRTKVIFPVHIGGYPVDMDPIMEIARQRPDIVVIEDAAHALGASYKGRMIGTIGHFGAFSFHEVKNVTSFGEGGLLVTNLDWGKEFPKARFLGLDLSHQIPTWLYDVIALEGPGGSFVAGNSSATEIQALCLSVQLKRLKAILTKRRKAAEYLNRRFRNVEGIVTPALDTDQIKGTHHLYLLQVDPARLGGDIQDLKQKLKDRGIIQIPHFAPLYKFSIMRQLGYDTAAIQASCPVAEEAFNHRFTHLPLYDFNQEQLAYLADAVIDAARELREKK